MSDRLAAILDRTGDPATVAWAHEGTGSLSALADPMLAIAAAGALGNIAALQSVSAPKDLRKAASAALHKLKSKGVKVEEKVAPRAFALTKEAVDVPSRAWISLPDAQGDVEILLTTTDDEGSCVLGMLVGGAGVREIQHGHVGRSQLREVWKSVEGRGQSVEVPFATGLHYADRFEATRGDHDWKHFLEHVSLPTLMSARLLDPVAHAPAGNEEEAAAWMVSKSCFGAAAIERGANALFSAADDEGVEELMVRLADEALAEGDRTALAANAEFVAEVFTLHGRAKSAAAAREVGRRVLAGEPGSSIPEVSASVRIAVYGEAQASIRERIADIRAQVEQRE